MSIAFRSGRLLGYMIGASVVAMAAPAMAQSAQDDGSGFGEIIVTAQKREQNLQQVPLAISAVQGETLELRGISEAKQLAAIAPNVSALGGTTSGAAAVITIRGIATAADESQGFDSPIGMYLNGVYLARSSASTFDVGDIERVEVLRGPQGTLFGRNTTGGAINFITKQPGKDAGFRLKAGIGNYGLRSVRGTIETGEFAGDSLRMALSGTYKRRNGVVDNLLQPKKRLDPGGDKTTGFMWTTVFEPNNIVKFTNIFDYVKSTGVPMAMQLAAVGSGVTYNPEASTTAFAAANNFSIAAPGPVAQFLAQNGTSILEAGCPSAPSATRRDKLCLNSALPSTDKLYGNLARIEVNLDGVTLRSSTAARAWRSHQRGGDLDGLGTINAPILTSASTLNGMPASLLSFIPTIPSAFVPFVAAAPIPKSNMSLFDATNERDQKQFSQELELVSNSDGAFNWVLGAFYFRESGGERNHQTFGFVLDTNAAVFNTTNFGALGPLFAAANPVRYRASLQDIYLAYRSRGISKALYGQAEWRPGGKDGAFGATLGLRYTWDKKFMRRTQNGATPFTSATDIALNTNSAKFSALTGNLTLDYRANDNLNLYARVAKGYRSGGFNARETNATTTARGGLLPFNNESIWSYELGFKTQWGRMLRLNGAVFHNVYSDLQVTVPIAFGGGGSSFGTAIGNAGKVTYTGFELEGQFRPTDYFWLDGNVGYTRKKFKEFMNANNANVVTNIAPLIKPGYAPDWTASVGANARFPLGGDAHATARVGYTYTSDYFQFTNPLNNPFYRETKGDARGLLDAQVRIDGIGIGGSKMDLTLWGKNLTNKSYIMRSVDFGALGFATNIYGDPRTYGATLGIEF